MTSNIENVVRQLIEEGFNKGNMDVVDAVTAPERDHDVHLRWNAK